MIAAAFLSGVTMITFAASGIFFLKFWKASYDRFFLLFSIACFLLAFERLAILILDGMLHLVSAVAESGSWFYCIRLAAFVLILMAVLEKNRTTK